MNIFFTNEDVAIASTELDDSRTVKMVLETTQMLMTAVHSCGINTPYKPAHINHPCSIWVRTSFENYSWTLDYVYFLNKEYSYRYNKTHKCFEHYEFLKSHAILFPKIGLTPRPNCTPNKHIDNIIDAYRVTLNQKWINDKRPPRWKNRTAPHWKWTPILTTGAE